MSKQIEALKLALEALKTVRHKIDSYQVNVCDDVDEAINAAEKVLAQPEQEPFCYVNVNAQGDVTRTMKRKDSWCKTPLYTTPPPVPEAHKRTWVSLDNDDIKKIAKKHKWHESNVEPHLIPVYRSLETKLKEKNT